MIRYANGRWLQPKTIDLIGQGQLRSLSCPATRFCMAIDTSGNAFRYNGSAWKARTIDPAGEPTGVSCASAKFCAAIDAKGNAIVYSAGSWGKPRLVDSNTQLWSVSCPAASFCPAVDASGHVVSYNGHTWSAPKLIDAKAQLWSVSCPARRYCAAVDLAGNVLTFNGASWRIEHHLRTGGAGLQAVSYGGRVFTLSKGSWATTDKISSSQTLGAVSCYSTGFCVAVAQGGDAVVGR